MFFKNNLLKIILNTVFGLVLIFFWLKLVNLPEIFQILKSTNLIVIPLFVIFFTLSTVLRSFRLKLLLPEGHKVSLVNIINLTFLAQFLSFTIPIRAGELAKGVYISSHHGVNFGRALILVFLDRFLDFLIVMVMVAVLLIFIPTNLPHSVEQTLLIVISFVGIGLIVSFLLPDLIKKVVQSISRALFFPKLQNIFTQFAYFGIDSMVFFKKDKVNSLKLLGLTILSVVSDAFQWFVILAALNYFPEFPKLLLGSGLSMLTYLIPAAPGYVGSAEASGLVVFHLALGMDKNIISAATVLLHALNFIFVLGFGIIGLYLLKFNLRVVWKKMKISGR